MPIRRPGPNGGGFSGGSHVDWRKERPLRTLGPKEGGL